jgi:hypothetical protein
LIYHQDFRLQQLWRSAPYRDHARTWSQHEWRCAQAQVLGGAKAHHWHQLMMDSDDPGP